MAINFNYQPTKMSLISHELRIPITGIMGMTYFLSQTSLTHEQKEFIKVIEIEAKRLLSLENKLHEIIQEKKG